MMRPLWDEHASGVDGETQEDGRIKEGGRDENNTERCGDGGEMWGNIVQILREGGGRAGGGSVTV